MSNGILPPIDQGILSWIITGGLVAIFILVWRVAVRIEGRLTTLDNKIKNLENNPLLVGYRDFQILQARKIFDPDDKLKRWEAEVKDKLPKEKQGEK